MSRRSTLAILAIAVFSVMTLTGIVLTLVLSFGDGGGIGLRDRIAVLEVDGLIADDREILRQIRRFRDDASVKGYVVAINSPGGVVAPSQSIFGELKRIREEDEKPVVASIGSVGASGGYHVALAADSILALPGSITGSIGVVMQFPDVSELMDRVGVRMEVIKSGEFKDLGGPFRTISDDEREIMVAMLDDVYAQFVDVVATERGMPREAVLGLADGRILTGRQAVEHGLVDATGNFTDAIAVAGRMAGLGDEPRIVRPPGDRFRLLELLASGPLSRTLEDLVRSTGSAAGPRVEYVVPF